MEIFVNWDNLPRNEYLEIKIMKSLTTSFKKYHFLTQLELNISKMGSNSRYSIKLVASTTNATEKLRNQGISCDVIPALNDLIMNFKEQLNDYDPKAYEKRMKLEVKWQEDAIKNREQKAVREAKYAEIIEENKRRAKQNEMTRRKNAQIKKDYEIQKDLLKKLHRQAIIDEETRYELQKDFLERQKAAEEKRLLAEARLKEVARIQKEAVNRDLGLEEKYKEQKTTLRELKESNNEVNKIKNEILKIQTSDYDEVWQANEPFQDEQSGIWYYHDGEGNIYEQNLETGEWVENTKGIAEKLEAIKQMKIDKLMDEKDKAQARQDKVSNDEYLNTRDESLDAKVLEKAEKDIADVDEKLKELIINKEKSIENFREEHQVNEPWLDENDNKYYYHDGEGNYFTTNENNEWVKCDNPAMVAIEKDYDLKKQQYLEAKAIEKVPSKNETKLFNIMEKHSEENGEAAKKDEDNKEDSSKKGWFKKNKKDESKDDKKKKKSPIPKANEAYEFDGKWYYFDKDGNYYTTDASNQWVPTINPHATGKTLDDDKNIVDAKEPEDIKTKALEDNYDHSEPFQDENGVWWYIDENNQYYYGDENGNWIKFEEN